MIEKLRGKTLSLGISGGKDSTALWLWAKYELKHPDILPIFADTGWEHADTYKYLEYLNGKLGGLVTVKPDRDFVELAKHKSRFPSARARFCTQHLKMVPTRNYLRSLGHDNIVMASGVRAEESPSRARMAEWVDTDDYYKLPQWRPILDWTWQDVFAYHDKYDIKPNPLYKRGMGRVGCMPCVMSNLEEVGAIARNYPETFNAIEEAEAKVGKSSFFSTNYIPERYQTGKIERSGKVHTVPTPEDVRRYALMDRGERRKHCAGTVPLFEEPENLSMGVCSSIYGLCE